MFLYIRSAAFIIVVTQKLVLQQSKNATAKCTETLSPPPWIQFSLILMMVAGGGVARRAFGNNRYFLSNLYLIHNVILKTYGMIVWCWSHSLLRAESFHFCKNHPCGKVQVYRVLRINFFYGNQRVDYPNM